MHLKAKCAGCSRWQKKCAALFALPASGKTLPLSLSAFPIYPCNKKQILTAIEKISIPITDDRTLVRENLVFLLNNDPRFNVMSLTGTGEEAIELAKQIHPDIVLMDISLPGITGIEATKAIREISSATKVIGVSMQIQPSYVYKMIQYGASG
jgi:CheY-like chemotaxis protein